MENRTEHRWAVDGIEEGVARIEEDGIRMISLPASLLPAGVKEGQLLRATRGPDRGDGMLGLTIVPDPAGTADALARSKSVTDAAMSESRKKDPGGDVSL
jgi:hypothetical protein